MSETYEGDVSCFWVEFYPNGVQGRGGQQQLDKLELEEYFGNRSKRQHSDPASTFLSGRSMRSPGKCQENRLDLVRGVTNVKE